MLQKCNVTQKRKTTQCNTFFDKSCPHEIFINFDLTGVKTVTRRFCNSFVTVTKKMRVYLCNRFLLIIYKDYYSVTKM